jgi:MFS superfamily sulfate permease-like transporter
VLSRALLRGFVSAVAIVIMMSVLAIFLFVSYVNSTLYSEQLTPMFGLTELGRAAHPETTLDKMFFLFRHALTDFHPHTTVISFTALLALVFCRNFKNLFKKYWWIYRMPEVLLVVAISTGTYDLSYIAYKLLTNC